MIRWLRAIAATLGLALIATGAACLGGDRTAPASPPAAGSATPASAPAAIVSATPGSPAGAVRSPTPAARPAGSPSAAGVPADAAAMAALLAATDPPRRDLVAIRRSVRNTGPAPTPVPPVPLETPTIGQAETLWVANLDTDVHFTMPVRLRFESPHALFYVEEGVSISDEDLRRAARGFEDRVYPSVSRYFAPNGQALPAGRRLTILHGRVPGVAGYFSSADLFPREVYPFSNERLMISVNQSVVPPGSASYEAVLAHEFAHAVSALNAYNPATWLNEGSAELASNLAGFPPSSINSFLANPDVQLNGWAKGGPVVSAHYGGAYLFLKYLFPRFGGFEAIPKALAHPGPGIDAIDRFLRTSHGTSFDAAFDDWIVANLIDSATEPRYSYPDDTIKVRVDREIGPDTAQPVAFRSPPYAGRYYRVRDPDRVESIAVETTPRLPVVANRPPSGRIQWWSNRGDLIDSTLTRSFDLTGVRAAHLEFSLWYNLEKNWDFGYLQASTDGGRTWELIATPGMSRENPTGNNLGIGWTGLSGGGANPVWVRETADLTPYAGQVVQIRFQYVTDEALESNGLTIDDLAVPEIGYQDDAESGSGWTARGFVPLYNEVPNRTTVRLIETAPGSRVVDAPIGADGRGVIRPADLVPGARDLVLVIAGHAPATTEAAAITLTVQARP